MARRRSMSGARPGIRRLAAVARAMLGLAAVASPVARGAAPAPTAEAVPARPAALDTLDRALARFAALLAQDDDPAHQAATRRMLDGFRQRRDALQAAFDASRCDDLRAELNLEYQRLAAWIGSPRA